MQVLYAVLFFAVMGGLYAALYYWNHKTPVPQGCENLTVDCDGCKVTSCGLHPVHKLDNDERRENKHA